MKTAIFTTTYLVPQERFDKTVKFLDYYSRKTNYDIYVLDNNSPLEKAIELQLLFPQIKIIRYDEHFDRPSHLDYKYLWRAVFDLQNYFNEYEKIIYMDNDFYILSDKMFNYINDLKDSWTTFWCKMHQFPETGCHIILKNDPNYTNFIKDLTLQNFINLYNNSCMENTLPVSKIEKSFNGDRFGELKDPPKLDGLDFWAQAKLEDRIEL